jgi:ABC-type dipeptide/oligopeptide/nickel transport system permease component
MLSSPDQRPPWLPLRLIVASAVAACAYLGWKGVTATEWPALLTGIMRVSADGTSLGGVMYGRVGLSFTLLVVSVLVAFCAGLLVVFTARRMGFGLPWMVGFLGRALAVVPVVALVWGAIGVLIGMKGWTIESLLPNLPAQGLETTDLTRARRLWWWLVPLWVLVVPLAGVFISAMVDDLRHALPPVFLHGLKARGLTRSRIHYDHVMPVVWPRVLAHAEALGLLALGGIVFVEDALNLPGWGAFFAKALREGDARGIAGCVYVAGWMAAAWVFLIVILREITTHGRLHRTMPLSSSVASVDGARGAVVVSVCLLVLGVCGFSGGDFGKELMATLTRMAVPLWHDLQMTLYAACVAGALAIALGGLSRLVHRLGVRAWSRVLNTLAWSPLFLWSLALVAAAAEARIAWLPLGVLASFEGAAVLCRAWITHAESPPYRAAITLGAGGWRAWRAHVLPEVFRAWVVWLPRAAAMMLIWIVLADSLPVIAGQGRTLGGEIMSAKESVLVTTRPLLEPALLTAICALCLWELSRMIRAFTATPR